MSDFSDADAPGPESSSSADGGENKTVLHALSELTGEVPKVLLRDTDSEHGTTPVMDPKARGDVSLPKGRGNYQVMGEIARGGMGVVLKGHDTDLGRDVALKVLDPELSSNPTVVQRFVEEAQIGGQLQHPGVVPVYELGQMSDERPFFTMKLIKGRTLSALLQRRKSLEDDRRRFLTIFEQVCQTVAYAHSKGVVHRDLKPANIMVGAFGEVQVVDWGLAKVLNQGGVSDELRARQSQLTVIETVRSGPGSVGSDSVVGSVMGTPAYMAPEQAMGEIEKVDERADVFSLGAILCELLTGEPPYVAGENERTIVLAANARLDPARERIAAALADDDLKDLCLECLAPSRQARPQNAEEVADRVHTYLSTLEERAHKAELSAAEARVKAAETGRRQRLTVALAATIVLSLVAFGVGYSWVERQREERARELEARAEGLVVSVDQAQAQVLELQGLGRFDQAVEVARGGLALVESSEVDDPALRERAERTVALAETRALEDVRRQEREARLRALRERTEEIGLERIALVWAPNEVELESEYVAAFREFGLDLETQDLPEALEVLQANGAGEEIAIALDDWAALRRQLHGWDAFEVEGLMSLAFDLDPDPTRTQLREALLAEDRTALLAMAEDPTSATLPDSTVWSLYRAINGPQSRAEAHRFLRRSADAQPDSFLLNAAAGSSCWDNGEYVAGTIYLAGARAIRPGNYFVHALMGDTLNRLGDIPGCVQAYTEALRINPEFNNVLPPLQLYTYLLGRHEESVDYAGRMLAYRPTAVEYELYMLRGRYMLGEIDAGDLIGWIDRQRSPTGDELMGAAWPLVFNPDPSLRDPESAIALARRVDGGVSAFSLECQALAHLRLGRAEEALACLERSDALREGADFNSYRFVLVPSLWAMALHGVGREEEARHRMVRARSGWRHVTQGRPEAWKGSGTFRLFEEAATLVGD